MFDLSTGRSSIPSYFFLYLTTAPIAIVARLLEVYINPIYFAMLYMVHFSCEIH